MFWEILDGLNSENLSKRATELQGTLVNLGDGDLIQFQNKAVSNYRLIFKPPLYHLYCAAFDGEVDSDGLTDFCSNIILSGK